ncbi:helix-turn-helix transcriptional regulator [Brevibacillus sp. BC25]|uniref:helix-turn-helix domain-containing protein n=1 Tax=Brevibacillus sp. BC25 TaxID=1144308 RepID=UPI000270DD64|nr:helix-turn-helix transcriptional regulator [Brevibacillus sp. BC25]EJL31789.1 putative transcriptional regulator [Brevibacillus sp. BC25]
MVVNLTSGDVIAIRLASEMNQKQFAEHVGISQSFLSDLENGRRKVSPYFVGKLTRKVDTGDPDLQERIRRLSAVADF